MIRTTVSFHWRASVDPSRMSLENSPRQSRGCSSGLSIWGEVLRAPGGVSSVSSLEAACARSEAAESPG